MEDKESDVRNYYQTHYNITLAGNLWQDPVDGITPDNYLKDNAYKECIKTKSLLLLAKENKLLDFVDYHDFLKAVKKENENRALSVKKGEIVYGMVNFTSKEYLGHLKTELEINLIKSLSQKDEDPLYITKEEIREYFNSHKEEWSENSTATKVWDISLAKEIEDSKSLLLELREQLSRDENMEIRKEMIKNFKEIHFTERIFTADSYKEDLYSCMEVRTLADKMQVNEVSTILESENEYHIVWVLDRQTDEEKAYKAYESRIKEALLHEKFNQYLEDYQSSLNIVLNNNVYRKIKIKY
ncbi:MAG: peptidylprolyl isomerase [Anaerocolumna sp.]